MRKPFCKLCSVEKRLKVELQRELHDAVAARAASPSAVVAFQTTLVPVSTIVTVAPGSTPAVASSTLPRKVAVVPLAAAEEAADDDKSRSRSAADRLREARSVVSP
jgi:hypothetical protein